MLIHEATFGDDKQEEAVNKRHSTIGEALGVATRMGAYRTVLTHFSQLVRRAARRADRSRATHTHNREPRAAQKTDTLTTGTN